MLFLVALMVAAFLALAWGKIFQKAGFRDNWLMGVGMAIPLINIALFLYFVFAEWPIQKPPYRWREP